MKVFCDRSAHHSHLPKRAVTAGLWSTRFRRSPRDHGGAEEHERGEDERRTGKFKRSAQRGVLSAKNEIGPDEVGEGLREESRSDHAGHSR